MSDEKWQKYLAEAKRKRKGKKRKKPSRKSGAGLERSLDFFLDTGPQKKGGWPGGKKRPSFRRKKFNNIRLAPTSTRPADRAGAGTAQPANIGDPLHTQKES